MDEKGKLLGNALVDACDIGCDLTRRRSNIRSIKIPYLSTQEMLEKGLSEDPSSADSRDGDCCRGDVGEGELANEEVDEPQGKVVHIVSKLARGSLATGKVAELASELSKDDGHQWESRAAGNGAYKGRDVEEPVESIGETEYTL